MPILTKITGNGYIPTSSLREILRELDEQLTEEELDGLIQEIDTDGSGTVDFDGQCLFPNTMKFNEHKGGKGRKAVAIQDRIFM